VNANANSTTPLRIMVFGAHPDDCDIRAGGTAALYAQRGHQVRFVSLTNGNAGHYDQGGAPLAWRRRAEAAAVAKRLSIDYIVLDHNDGQLVPSLEIRAQVVALIRQFAPDLVMAPRLYDYHPDHRATAQLVTDAMYMLTVPNYVSAVRHLDRMPVAVSVWDSFQRPVPFSADVVVDISSTLEAKVDALDCHVSQVYEWLPYNRGELDSVPVNPAERRAWLYQYYAARARQQAAMYRAELVARYGEQRAEGVTAVEAFEGSEYGSPLTVAEIERLFPF
jgi:LmbE family N-acetylglucosaminyl deacetylase